MIFVWLHGHVCLPPAIYVLSFTANKGYPCASASSSNINKPRQRAAGREYLVYDDESDKYVQRGVQKQQKAAEARRARQEAAFMHEEQAKQANMNNITTVLGMSKEDFRAMRSQNFYNMPNNSSNNHFWRKEQELIMTEIYAKLDPKALVCPQKPLNLDELAKKKYFQDAIWVVKKLGLEHLISLQQNYDIEMIQQFYATLELGDKEDTGMT